MNGSNFSENRGVKGTRGRYLAHSARAKIRPYSLYSRNRHFASQSGQIPAPKKASMNSYPVPDRRSALSCGISHGCCLFLFVVLSLGLCPAQLSAQTPELTRTIRTWEFLPVVGTRAGLFGNETGQFEAWVYPLKIFRDFHLTFLVGDRALPADSLARTLTVHPESASILYVGDSFRVRET